MLNKIRLRFPPSPTGSLHIGSLRTVLFNYLAAKKLGGKLILRIEDTDQNRKVEGAKEKLIDVLDWVGVKFDEGPHIGGKFGPYIQTERLDIYKKYIDELLKKGEAYYCFCAPERLQKMREEQRVKKLPPRYDRTCRDLNAENVKKKLKAGDSYVIRQKMPLKGEVAVHDELRGDIKFMAEDLDDHVLIKSDGIPTYQFANVVDDYLMEISHILKGDEWLPTLPKTILLYQAFGWKPPKFIHLPVVLNKEGRGKLSKRQGDTAVEDYRVNGYLPEALLNFCALLGWHPKDDNEILSLKEMEEQFNIENIGASPAIFDIEKLDYLNGYYIRKKSGDELVELCKPYFIKKIVDGAEWWQSKSINTTRIKQEQFRRMVLQQQERLKKLSEIVELTEFFFIDKLEYKPELLIWKKITKKQVKENLGKVYELLEKIPEENWTNDSIEDALMGYLQAKELRAGGYLWPMRAALTGKKASPGPFEVAEVLGKEKSLERVRDGIKKLEL